MSTNPAFGRPNNAGVNVGALPWPDRYGRIIRDNVTSTMTEAKALLPTLTQPTWVMAHRQTAARGRQGKVWDMPPGNFAATLIHRPAATLQEAARRSFMAANALFEALALSVDRNRLALKWPNDVLFDDGKVAGILLESGARGEYVDWLAIGIGVNLVSAPIVEGAAFAPVAISEAEIGPEALLTRLADCYATQEDKLATFGFTRIRDDWLGRGAKLGEEITVKCGATVMTGIFDTIDQGGNLILQTKSGTKIISAADIYF